MRRTPTSSTSGALLAAASILLSACGPPAPASPDPAAPRTIEAMLRASAESWTRGDLDGFLDDYAEDATFAGASGLVRGRDRIRERYLRSYWSSGTSPDGLRFEQLETRMLGPAAAVVTGRYVLFDRETAETNATGLFSLTLRHTGEGWEIVHDHSSASE